tara:strand:+ start:5892 stop:6701 length:810 start_codon:yes stop_codon:yes gene_type:complete
MDPEVRSEGGFSDQLSTEFERHAERLRERARARRESVKLRASVFDNEDHEEVSEEASLGKWQPQDEFQGDVNMRTLRTLLRMVDERGFERSAHQLAFHSAFERATSRIIYREVRQKMLHPQHTSQDLLFTHSFFPLTRATSGLGDSKAGNYEKEQLGQMFFRGYDQASIDHSCVLHSVGLTFAVLSQYSAPLWEDLRDWNFCRLHGTFDEMRGGGVQVRPRFLNSVARSHCLRALASRLAVHAAMLSCSQSGTACISKAVRAHGRVIPV